MLPLLMAHLGGRLIFLGNRMKGRGMRRVMRRRVREVGMVRVTQYSGQLHMKTSVFTSQLFLYFSSVLLAAINWTQQHLG